MRAVRPLSSAVVKMRSLAFSPTHSLSSAIASVPTRSWRPSVGAAWGRCTVARDSRLEREIALKVLPAAFANDPDRLRRFRDEALAASRLSHPNIVQVLDVGSEGSIHFVVMELVEGETFRALLSSGPLPWARLERLALQVVEGIAKAHEAGVVHRDLKTENVMLSSDGYVKILDFGLARRGVPTEVGSLLETLPGGATTPGTVLGTAGYMSPEQAKGLPADHRSDQFSLGVVIYEMACGESPFLRATPAESLAALLTRGSGAARRANQRLPCWGQ